MRRSLLCVAAVLAGASAMACGGAGQAAKAVRADQPSSKDALGGTACTNPNDELEPWVIDLPGDQRGSLKHALEKGVVIVSYDCKSLKVLRNCSIPGNYRYAGTGFNEDTFRLEDTDSVKATLSGGAALAAKLDADMKRGTKLDIAYAVIGEANTTVPAIPRTALHGASGPNDCKSATHFVATASVGAFVMRSSTDANVGAAAEILGQGASARSTSSAAQTSSSGKRGACQSGVSSADPVNDCDIPLKLRLVPIADSPDKAPTASHATTGLRAPPGCPDGMVRQGERCVPPSKAPTRTCKSGDAKNCEDMCKAGDGSSCGILGYMLEKGKGTQEDTKRALEVYEAGCSKRDLNACTGLGFLYSKGIGGVPKDVGKAQGILKDACGRGSGRACSGLGHQLRVTGDNAGAAPWMEKGCDLGYPRACFYAGAVLAKTNADPNRIFRNHERACQGEDLRGCLAMAGMLNSGKGSPANQSESLRLRDGALKELDKRCKEGKDAESCEAIGDYHMGTYDPSARHPEKALEYYGQACSDGADNVCMDYAKILEKGSPPYIPVNAKAAKQLYEVACLRSGIPEACKASGKQAPPGVGGNNGGGAPVPGASPKSGNKNPMKH